MSIWVCRQFVNGVFEGWYWRVVYRGRRIEGVSFSPEAARANAFASVPLLHAVCMGEEGVA